jgi:FixJ family two-component response regulator
MLQLATEGTTTDEVVPVLLIEDDEADAILVREYLHDAGLGVSLSWQQSLAAATPELQAGPVCVLLDLGLPDSVGFDGLRHVLTLAPDAAVLVLTGASDASLGVAAMTAGAQDYLIKGQVDGATLSRCIRYAIERKRAKDAAQRKQLAGFNALAKRAETAWKALPCRIQCAFLSVSNSRPFTTSPGTPIQP